MTTTQLDKAITAFVQRWVGQPVDVDKKFGNQCWDLAALYAREVVGCPSLPTRPIPPGGAVDCYNYFLTPLPGYFIKFARGALEPRRGDLVIWSGQVADGEGHIAIFLQPLDNGFVALSQNAPLGTNTAVRNFSYNNVIGFLRPKVEDDIDMQEINKLWVSLNETNINLNKLYTICHNNNIRFDQLISALSQQDKNFNSEIQAILGEIAQRPTNAQLEEIKASIKNIMSQSSQAVATSLPAEQLSDAPKVSLLTKVLAHFVKPDNNVQA